MGKIMRQLVLGVAVTAAVSGLLTSPLWLQSAMATDVVTDVAEATELVQTIAPALDLSNLVKFEGREYAVSYEDGTVSEPLSVTRIKKVEYGKVSYVDVATTISGTYSSEALFSPHVKYPGIHVVPTGKPRAKFRFSSWSAADGWTAMSVTTAGSFTYHDFANGFSVRN
jgi:hypothetical protein